MAARMLYTLMRPTSDDETFTLPFGVSAINASPANVSLNFFVVMSAALSRPYVTVRFASPPNCLP